MIFQIPNIIRLSYLLPGLLTLTACSGGEVDLSDELGTEADEYELVYVETTRVEEVSQTVVRERATVPAEQKSMPPDGDTATTVDQPIVFDDKGEYTVQIGVYDASQAAQLVVDLSRDGYPAYAIPSSDTSRTVRVRIGYFKTKIDAQNFGTIFKADRGGEFWVDRRANE